MSVPAPAYAYADDEGRWRVAPEPELVEAPTLDDEERPWEDVTAPCFDDETPAEFVPQDWASNSNGTERRVALDEASGPARAGSRLLELDPAALHGLAGEYALAVQPYTEASVVAILLPTLIAFGNAVNRSAYMQVGGTTHYANEFGLLVGSSATARKGDATRIGMRPIEHANPEWEEGAVKSGFGSGEAIVEAVRDPGNGDDGTTDKRLLIQEDEFAQILTVAAREGSTLSSLIRRAWDSRRLENRTKGRALVATGAHVSILASITPEELVGKTPGTELANGFLNRFLPVVVGRARLLDDPPRITPEFDSEWAGRFAQALDHARRAGAGRMDRDRDARELWKQIYGMELSIERYGLAGAVCSRAEAHALRLSMIYALLDCSKVIRVDHVRAALALWRYCEASAYLVFGTRLGNVIADTILDAIPNIGDELTRTAVRDLFNRHRRADEIDVALNFLHTAGYVTRATRATSGRPVDIIRRAK